MILKKESIPATLCEDDWDIGDDLRGFTRDLRGFQTCSRWFFSTKSELDDI